MQVWLYRKNTIIEGETILQLKYLLNHTTIPCDVHKDVNAVGDFVQAALPGHITACKCFGMESLGDKPNPDLVPSNLESLDKEEKRLVLSEFGGKSYPTTQTLLCRVKCSKSAVSIDGVQKYAKEFLPLTQSYEESGREMACVMRVLQYWKSCCLFSRLTQLFY